MTANSQLITTTPKSKLGQQLEQEQNHRNGDHMKGYRQGSGSGRGGKGTENKKHKWQVENRHGEGKNSIGKDSSSQYILIP